KSTSDNKPFPLLLFHLKQRIFEKPILFANSVIGAKGSKSSLAAPRLPKFEHQDANEFRRMSDDTHFQFENGFGMAKKSFASEKE
ncbi:hypothetical protein AVEN_111489-1, partial [Araneus ventricosus]